MSIEQTAFEKFLATKPINENYEFGRAAAEAALEIAQEETVNLTNHSSLKIDNRTDTSGWLEGLITKENISQTVNDWEENNRGIFFRGSKNPDANLGSFGFSDVGVHLTPYVYEASNYASLMNLDTKVGRLLQTDYSEHATSYKGLGFVSMWEVPMEQQVWRNFEYENNIRYGRDNNHQPKIKDMLGDMQRIANMPDDDFKMRTIGEYDNIRSLASIEYGETMQKYYETLSLRGATPDKMFLQNTQGVRSLYLVDHDNPKWDKFMARIQEANFRDLYEILPLQQTKSELNQWIKHLEYYKNKFAEVTAEIDGYNKELERLDKIQPPLLEEKELLIKQQSIEAELAKFDLPETDDDKNNIVADLLKQLAPQIEEIEKKKKNINQELEELNKSTWLKQTHNPDNILEKLLAQVEKSLDNVINREWQCETMEQAKQFAKDSPWITSSLRVGSESGVKQVPPNIEKINDVVKEVMTVYWKGGDHTKALSMIAELERENNNKMNLPQFVVNQINGIAKDMEFSLRNSPSANSPTYSQPSKQIFLS